MEFSDWITQKYLHWRGNAIGHDRSVKQFATEYIGVSQPLMTEWMRPNGSIPRSARMIHKLAARYGLEVYQVLGLSPPETDNYDAEWQRLWDLTPPEYQQELKALAHQWLKDKGIEHK